MPGLLLEKSGTPWGIIHNLALSIIGHPTCHNGKLAIVLVISINVDL
jgi:hypothetical protein